MIARRHVSAPGPAAIAIGGDAKGPVTATYVDTQLVLGPSSIPVAVAVKNPAVVYAAVGLDGFTGRDWLVAEVDGFIAGNPRGYVFVTANAGLGKTAFAAWLARERGYLSHFSRYADGRSVRAALQNLSAQLVSQYGLHDQAPDGMLPDWAQTPGGFESLLGLAARVAAERGRPLVIVVDGLDEAEPVDDGLPFGLPSLLPDGVYVIGTSRTGSPPGRPDAPAVTLRIGNTDQRNIGDIRAFLRHAAGEEVLAGRLAQAGVDTGEFVDLLAERCAGVWVYLRYALQELRIGLRRPDKIGQLPAGLRDYYAAQIRRWQADPAWGTGLLPLLATLGVAGEPLPAATLARLSGGEARRLDVAAVRHWCSLTIRPLLATARRHADGQAETVYEIYHASFTEVLAGDLPAGADDEQLAEWIDLADELRQAALAAHARIVGTYLAEFGGLAMGLPTLAGSPDAAGADGGYPLRHLVRHLEQARCWADADALLAAGHSAGADRVVNSWFAAHEHADSLVSYLDDLRRAHSVAAAATDTELAASWLAPSLGREIRYALMIASMISRTMGMSPTLLIHAVKAGLWTPHRGLDQARRLGPSARVDALMGIRPYLPPAEQPGIVAEALATATAIDWGEHRASALAMLAPWLTADQRAEAIAAAAAIGTVQHRTMAVTALARQLPAAQQHEVLAAELAAVAAIGQAESRCNGLLVLAPHLPPDLLGPALDAAAGIGRGAVREHALARLAPLLPPDLLAPALAAAIDFGGDDSRPARPEGAALAALAPHLPPVLLAQALADASAIPAERQRAEALAVLAPHLPPDTLGHALAAAIAIRYEYERGQALAALAPQLSPGLFAQALAAAITITSEQFRAQALAGLAAQPPPDVLADLLAAARSITDQRHRAQVLAALAPHLPAGQREDVLAEALAAADATTHEYHRARIIADLAPHLPPGLLAQALADASTIPHEAYRARALAALAPYLPAGLLAQALAAAAVIADGRARGTALAGLAPCLRPEQLAQALAAAAEITEESPRADALQALVPHLPPDLVAQALAAAVAMAPHMYRVHVLTALAPRLSADQLAQALATASETGFVRSWALARLAPYLPPSVLADALAISTAVADADVGVRALVALASQLATAGQPGALAQILAAAMAVTSGRGHAEALTALVPSLPADERPAVIDQVLSAAAEITDEGQRADALTGLAAGLPAGQPAVLAKVGDGRHRDHQRAAPRPRPDRACPAAAAGQPATGARPGPGRRQRHRHRAVPRPRPDRARSAAAAGRAASGHRPGPAGRCCRPRRAPPGRNAGRACPAAARRSAARGDPGGPACQAAGA